MEALLEKYASGEQSSGSSSPHRSDQNELVTAQNLSSGVSQQFDALTLADYARTKYIGISAGVHLLDDDVFRFKRRVKLENRGILQKVNDDEDEHVLVRSQVASHPPVRPSFEYHRSSLFSENLPQMTVELADHLVELFFKYIHLYLPILNKITFLEQYYFANPHPPERNLIYSVWSISLWITLSDGTQLAGGPLVDADIIKELRNTLRQNVCQAAEKAHTQSSITTLQWLILASLIIEFCEEEDIFRFRLVYYWCCASSYKARWVCAYAKILDISFGRKRCRRFGWQSISGCIVILYDGLFHNLKLNLRRRIWHCINLIDKWIAADLGRPPTIADEDFDVEWPTATELASPYNTLDAPDIPEILVQAREDLTRQRPIYSIFQAATMTTSILDQILRGFYSPKKQSSEIPNLELAKKLEAELQQWRNTIWPSVWHVNNPCSPFPALIDVSYYCLVLLLHRPFIQHKDSSVSVDDAVALRALPISTQAAQDLLHCMEALMNSIPSNIYLTMCTYPCFQAAIIFLFHARSDNQITRRQGINNLTHFIRLFKSKGGLRVHRLVRILESLSSKFAVPVSYMEPIVQTQLPPLEQEGRNHQQQQPDVQQYREESILSMYHPLNNNSQDMQSSGSAQPQISDTSATLAPYLPPSASTPFQFDSTNLTSDIPLWSLPVGFTWSDWETFLQANIF